LTVKEMVRQRYAETEMGRDREKGQTEKRDKDEHSHAMTKR